jgi:hypothetical protein
VSGQPLRSLGGTVIWESCRCRVYRLARLDEISLCLQLPKANKILALGPFGPPGRPRGPLPPSNCAKIAGVVGAPPPPGAAARHLLGSPKPPKNLRLRRKTEGSCSPRRTALRIPQKSAMSEFRASWIGPICASLSRAPTRAPTREAWPGHRPAAAARVRRALPPKKGVFKNFGFEAKRNNISRKAVEQPQN